MNHEDYMWYRSLGMCTACRKRKAIKGQTVCPDCRDKRREYERKRYLETRDEKRDYHKRYNKSLYEARKAAGICVRCGKHPPETGKWSCTTCLRKQSQYKQEAFRRKGGTPRWLAMDLGLCAVCCKYPVLHGKRICESCYAKVANRREKTA